MVPKIKKFIKNNKKQIKIGIIVLIILILLLSLYKSFFYSDSQKAIYGVRIRDIKENEFKEDEKSSIKNKASKISGVKDVDIKVKGRLIKFFVTFEDGVSNDDIKAKFNEMLSYVSSKVKDYYDISFYSKETINGEVKYPVIGYKHKSKQEISFDVL